MADKLDGENLSTQKTLKSSHDPGWNDPPKWALSSSSTKSTPTKRLLNKRVAFPLSSSPSTTSGQQQQQLPLGNLPPPPAMITPLTTAPHAPLFTPTTVTPIDQQKFCPKFKDKDEILLKTMDNLEFVVSNELSDSSKINDVKKRLEIMKNLWKEGKFSDEIMREIYLISEELKSKNIENAEKLHISLMTSHATICTNGVSGIRHLIFELREKYSQSEIEGNVKTTQPLLLFNPSSAE